VEKILLSIREVSEMTRISVGTLYHWVSQNRVPVVRFSRRCIKFRRSDIERLISERVEGPAGHAADGSNQSSRGTRGSAPNEKNSSRDKCPKESEKVRKSPEENGDFHPK